MKDQPGRQSRRSFLQTTSIMGAALPILGMGNSVMAAEAHADTLAIEGQQEKKYQILKKGDQIEITAGSFSRVIDVGGNQVKTLGLRVEGRELLAETSVEFKLNLYQAFPNRRPPGLVMDKDGGLQWADGTAADAKASNQPAEWQNVAQLDGGKLSAAFKVLRSAITKPKPDVTRLHIKAGCLGDHVLKDVYVNIYYEVYQGFPVIRKWISIGNNGSHWLKIDRLTIDEIGFKSEFLTTTPLTPEEQGAESSIISFSDPLRETGVIAASEIPSAPRRIGKNGSMGYSEEYFEWIVGPSEEFVSEPVFHFAFSGKAIKTISGISTPMDRASEGPFKQFLQKCVGLLGASAKIPAPIWCSYTNFLVNLSDENMREQADIAARIGFDTFQLDEGWAGTPSPGGSEPGRTFPDFENTCQYILSKGLKLGLWISCFRGLDAKDLVAIPEAMNLPRFINTKRGYGMSFTSKWRDYFMNDIVYMRDKYGMTYVKEDLTNISKGDIAEGHESRTKKESLLRGLRGLLAVNKTLAETAPDLWTQITHEIYWRTPGPPADIAALKHACAFHTTPNTYLGAGNGSKRVSQDWPYDPLKLRADLIKSCDQARHRYYDHRGLPVHSVEFYAANAINIKGSLTAAVQDRQVCSWLMGAPTVFAGDLSSLTEDQVRHYRKRFDLLKALQRKYDIYGHFQYSGVPLPTDTDWHWWGKINEDGFGVVVVLRGKDGEPGRLINIPWVHPEKKYQVILHFSGKKMGVFSGRELINGKLKLTLPVYGQEILEVAKA